MNFNFKAVTIFSIILILNGVNSNIIRNEDDSNTEEIQNGFHTMTQKIDHFNASDSRTFEMKYACNDGFYKEGGPILIYVGGEAPISEDIEIFNYYEMYVTIAEELHGVLFHTEHRYYGDSQPFEDLKLENLKYLTMDQITADLAHFIKKIKATKKGLKNSKVVLAGCSYPGTVVARFLQLYPDLAEGGWASGALQLSKPDYEYLDLAGETFQRVSPKCYDKIKNTIESVEEILFTKENKKIEKLLGYCEETRIGNKELNYLDVVQTSVGASLQTRRLDDLKGFCDIFEKIESPEDAFQYLYDSSGMRGYYKVINEANEKYKTCGNYLHLVKSLNKKNSQRVYTYQGCVELGVNAPSKTFFNHKKFEKDVHLKACEDIFGITKQQVKKNIKEYNQRFGGLHPNITNIVWSSGDLDPWRGVQVQTNNDGSSAVIPNVNHCGEWSSISDWDPPATKAMKTYIKNKLIGWATGKSTQ